VAQTADTELIGRLLGDFEVLQCIGTGGMGTVYQAHQRGMQRQVAIKVLPADLAADRVLLQRFYQEARTAAKLDHPNIVRAIAVGEQDGMHYFAMEYVEGETLARLVKRSGPLQEREAVNVIAGVATALEIAHTLGIIHRDVKPENVLITPDGRAKLADFGLVKRSDQDLGLTQVGRGLGTTNYMAPEQFRAAKHVDHRSDIYSLGTTLYTALTGVIPWRGLDMVEMYKRKVAGDLTPVRQLNPRVSAEIEAVIVHATRGDPRERPAACGQFLSELEGRTRPPRPPRVEEVATRAAIELPISVEERSINQMPAGVFFVQYLGKTGAGKMLKLRTDEIREALKTGRYIPQHMRIARAEQGPWLPPNAFPEFASLAAQLSRSNEPADEKADIEADIARTVKDLRAGAPLRRIERGPWGLVLWIGGVLALVALGVAAWLSQR
jgi:serine/threonine-protein kinase